MQYQLSVLCPGIRTRNWLKLYESIGKSFSGTWEIVFITPYDLPEELKDKDNIKLIKSWQSPLTAQQMGICYANAEWITWTSDDGVFVPSVLDKSFELIKGKDYKTVLVFKYIEGDEIVNQISGIGYEITKHKTNHDLMASDEYYYLDFHVKSNYQFVPKGTYVLSFGMISKKLMIEIGGWDCRFEVCPMALCDLSIRLKKFGANFIIQPEVTQICGHMPGHAGDHGPIHDGQTLNDQPIFEAIYTKKESCDRIKIDFNNWVNAPKIWTRRFKKEDVMDFKLSVLVPGIRTVNWENLYNSISSAFSGAWEIIFVGPYPLPPELNNKLNIKYCEDWGTPIRCQQIALKIASGEYISWAADDGYYLPSSLDVAFEKLKGQNYKSLIMGKYLEGDGDTDPMTKDLYYYLSTHDACRATYIPKEYLMLNVGVVSAQLLKEIGGWDCQFEVCPMAYNDLAVRLQNWGVKFIIQQEMMFKCSHLPGHAGDHGPIHDAQIYHDQPLFRNIYDQPKGNGRTVIALNNWQDAPEKWWRRFK